MEIILAALAVLIVCLLIGVPVPFTFIASALVVIVMGGYDPSFLIPYGYNKAGSIILIAVPLFIIAGGVMEKGDIGKKLIDLVEIVMGRFKGGLGAVSVVSCAIFGAISGSGAATLACIGSVMFPRLEKSGYPKGYSAALLSNACVLGLLIPPSLNMILFAFVGGQSVLASFLATFVPGVILITFMCVTNYFILRKSKTVQVTENYSFFTTVSLLRKKTFTAIPALMMPVIILGGIYGGAMTPTEAAAVSVLYAVPVGMFVYKKMSLKDLYETVVTSGTTTGVILTMLLSVMILSRLYIMENVPETIMQAMLAVSENRIVLILMLNVFILLVGMLMDDTSAILLSTPILLPIAVKLGIDPIHFAAILGVNSGMGNVTPPCAPFLYLGSRLGRAPINEMMGPTLKLILFAWIPTLAITTFVPEVSLWLPNLILK